MTETTQECCEQYWTSHADTKKQQLYGHLPPITKTIKVRRTRRAGYFWRSKDELISDVLQWTPSHGRAKAGRPARTYIQQLCADTGCSPEDLPEAMDDREGWRERVRVVPAEWLTWWRWWYREKVQKLLTIWWRKCVDENGVGLKDLIPYRNLWEISLNQNE